MPLTLFRFWHLGTTLGTKTDRFRASAGLHPSLPTLSGPGFQPVSRASELLHLKPSDSNSAALNHLSLEYRRAPRLRMLVARLPLTAYREYEHDVEIGDVAV